MVNQKLTLRDAKGDSAITIIEVARLCEQVEDKGNFKNIDTENNTSLLIFMGSHGKVMDEQGRETAQQTQIIHDKKGNAHEILPNKTGLQYSFIRMKSGALVMSFHLDISERDPSITCHTRIELEARNEAYCRYGDIKAAFPNEEIILTGHALGGAIAEGVSDFENERREVDVPPRAISFNAPGHDNEESLPNIVSGEYGENQVMTLQTGDDITAEIGVHSSDVIKITPNGAGSMEEVIFEMLLSPSSYMDISEATRENLSIELYPSTQKQEEQSPNAHPEDLRRVTVSSVEMLREACSESFLKSMIDNLSYYTGYNKE